MLKVLISIQLFRGIQRNQLLKNLKETLYNGRGKIYSKFHGVETFFKGTFFQRDNIREAIQIKKNMKQAVAEVMPSSSSVSVRFRFKADKIRFIKTIWIYKSTINRKS